MRYTLKTIIEGFVAKELQDLFMSESWRGFSMKTFNRWESTADKLNYAAEKLPKLGSGSARSVFGLGSGKVLKIARTKYATRQNENEVEAYTSGRYKDLLAKIYDFDKNYVWLVSEGVKVIIDNADLMTKFTIPEVFLEDIETFFDQDKEFEESVKFALFRNPQVTAEDLTELDKELVHKLWKALKLGMDDINRFDHWGLTTNGRLVIVDYGLQQGNS